MTVVPIRAVIFDVGTVLVHEEPVERLLDAWHARSGVPVEDLADAIAANDPVDFAVGRVTERHMADELATRFSLAPDQVEAWMADFWDWYCGTSNEMVRSYARSLRPQFRTAILSNSFDGARREEERRLRFQEDFDPIVYSHEVGLAKPDPRVFEYTLKALGCTAREVAYVDDRSENVEAASALGIRAMQHIDTVSTLAWFDRLLDRA